MFTKNELYLLANGMIELLDNARSARTQVRTEKTIAAIDSEIQELMALHQKICKMANEISPAVIRCKH